MANILVTGGAGFIGCHLTGELVQRGHEVRVLDDLSSGEKANLEGLDVEICVDDIREKEAVSRAVDGIDTIFHLAAFVSVPESMSMPFDCYQTNVMGSLNVLQAAQQTGVRRVVLASSAAIYGERKDIISESDELYPVSPYAASKISMEHLAQVHTRGYNLETVCLRFFNVFGPNQSPDSPYAAVIPQFINDLESGDGITILGDGQQTRDFVYIDDVVGACMLAMESEAAVGESINIASGLSVTILELARILQGFYPEAPEVQFGAPRAGDVRFSQADITKAKEALGYRPKTELEEGLRHTVEWFKSNRR